MSAFYYEIFPDRIELLTDAAFYSDDGTLSAIGRKVWASEHLPLAVTGRGDREAIASVAAALMAAAAVMTTVNEVVNCLEKMLADRKGGTPAEHIEILVAAISETDGPASFYANTHGRDGFEAWQLYRMPEAFGAGPQPTDTEIEAILQADDGKGLDQVGVPLMEVMRRKAGRNPVKPDLPEIYGIGGFVDLTVISALGCTTETIHAWPDEIGKKIDPFAADVAAA